MTYTVCSEKHIGFLQYNITNLNENLRQRRWEIANSNHLKYLIFSLNIFLLAAMQRARQ